MMSGRCRLLYSKHFLLPLPFKAVILAEFTFIFSLTFKLDQLMAIRNHKFIVHKSFAAIYYVESKKPTNLMINRL